MSRPAHILLPAPTPLPVFSLGRPCSHMFPTCSPAVSWDIMLPNRQMHNSICSYSTLLAKDGDQHTSILSAGRTEYISVRV